MVATQRREVAIGWDNIKRKKVPIGTNYPAMQARDIKMPKKNMGWVNTSGGFGTEGCVGTIVEPRFVNKEYTPTVYSTPQAIERSRLQEEADRKFGSTFGSKKESRLEKVVSGIRKFLKF